ncbi:MAG: DUF2911 domain-containing protein [Flavobacteriales bacterium]
MKKILFLLLTVSIGLFSQTGVTPRLSPKSSITSTVGFTEIRIDYSSPGVKGRKVFGDLEGYGTIWRAGANEATKITFSTDVKVNGHTVPKGSYSFFVIPEVTNEWTLIFNKVTDQWGVSSYDESKDFLRLVIEPDFTQESRERLIYDIQSNGIDKATIQLYWSLLKLPFVVEVDFMKDIDNQLERVLKEQKPGEEWRPYYDLANFFSRPEYNHPKTEMWIDKVLTDLESSSSENNDEKESNLDRAYWVKAKLLAKNNRKKQAWALFQQISTGKRSQFIHDNIGRIQNTAAEWATSSQ